MQQLSSVDGLVVSQQKEWGEIVSGFETRNRYIISDTSGNQMFLAAEEAGSTIVRLFLKALRPFTIDVLSHSRQVVLRVTRPFRFFFHRAEVEDVHGQVLGSIERRFAVLRRKYAVLDRTGREIFQLYGPILHPWTFQIKDGELELGKITKKWSGLLKEGFTDADNFGVVFPIGLDAKVKALFLGAVFLIDFVHFENKGN